MILLSTRHLAALLVAASAAVPGSAPALAATYYVDFAAGSDKADGLSAETPWKRAPGDSRAGPGPRATHLQPGDTILFRGGVAYRGTIVVRAWGTPDAPIRYVGDAWGAQPAILDGSEELPQPRPCRSARDCGGDAAWPALHRLSLSGDTDMEQGPFQQDQQLDMLEQGDPLKPGSARPIAPGSRQDIVLSPIPGLTPAFTRAAGRVGFLLVAGRHLEIRGFRLTGFAPAPGLGPYAGRPLVQLQPLADVTLAAMPVDTVIHRAPPVGQAIAGVTSGPI